MSTNLQLVPFAHGDILAMRDGDKVQIIMPAVVENIGLDWESQRQRIERHPLMAETTCVMQVVTSTGAKPTTVMTLEGFHTFLVTLHPDRITDTEVRERVLAYQRRAFRAVFEHFHGPMRISSGKRPTITDLIRTSNALKKERNRATRALLWQQMDLITDSLGLSRCERAIGYDAPDWTDLQRYFWEALRALDEAGRPYNQSRRNDLIALHLPSLRRTFVEVGVPVDLDSAMRNALRHSTEPRFIAEKPVNCADGIIRHCWVFNIVPPHKLPEPV